MDEPRYENYLAQMFALTGKTALITGAGGGIGRELASGLALSGARAALCDIGRRELDIVKEGIETEGGVAQSYILDVTDLGNIKACVDEIIEFFGKIDVLVNCAGINIREDFLRVREDAYDRIMNVNLKGSFFVSQCVAENMIENNGGSIINIGSHNTGAVLGGVSVYAAAKSGLLALTRSMAVEWAEYNIRANCISPGHILTQLTATTWDDPHRSKYLCERISMRRPGKPNEITGLCVFLASDAASYITGSEYRVDGGCMAGGAPWKL